MRSVSAITIAALIGSGAVAETPRKATRSAVRVAPKPIIAPPHVVADTGNLSPNDLIAIGKLADIKTDQFSDDASLKYVGRQFVVMIPASALSTSYNKDTKTLKISTSTYEDGFELRRDETRSKYEGQNAYGAKTTVTRVRGYAYGIEYPGKKNQKNQYIYTATMEGAQARQLSMSLTLRLTGTIIVAEGIWAKEGSIFFEHHIISDATVSSPYDNFIRRYYVASKITKAEWIDTQTGNIVKADMFVS